MTESSNHIKRLVDGDSEAFDEVFRCYYGKVSHFIGSLIDSNIVAEDLAQEVFIRLWKSRASLSQVKSLNRYIYVSAKNAAIDYIRRTVSHETLMDSVDLADDDLTDEKYFALEKELMIRFTVDNMPEQRKRVFSMSRFDGLSNDEIAAKLGISKKTVENHINLALRQIRNISGIIALFCVIS